jgi:hypothetical protein
MKGDDNMLAVTNVVPEHDHCANIVPAGQFVQDDREMCVALGSPRITEANPFKLLGIESNATIDDAIAAYQHKSEVFGVASGGHAIHEAKLGAKSPLAETWFESMTAWVEIGIRGTANVAGILVLVLVAMDRKLSFGGTIDQSYVGAFVIAMMCLNTALGDNIGSSDKPPPLLDGKTGPTQSDDAISHNVNLMDRGELPLAHGTALR